MTDTDGGAVPLPLPLPLPRTSALTRPLRRERPREMPRLVIQPGDVAPDGRENPRLCPMARALCRELGIPLLPGDRPHRPPPKGSHGIEVYAGDPGERGWVRYYHPRLTSDYIWSELDAGDSALIQRYDATGELPAPVRCELRAGSITSGFDHEAGIPPEGATLAAAEWALGVRLDPEDDLELADMQMSWDDPEAEWRYYCHCYPCIDWRRRNDREVEADSDAWGYDPDSLEGWDEGRMR